MRWLVLVAAIMLNATANILIKTAVANSKAENVVALVKDKLVHISSTGGHLLFCSCPGVVQLRPFQNEPKCSLSHLDQRLLFAYRTCILAVLQGVDYALHRSLDSH